MPIPLTKSARRSASNTATDLEPNPDIPRKGPMRTVPTVTTSQADDTVTTVGLVAKAGEIQGMLAVLGARPMPPRLRVTCEAAVQYVTCSLEDCGARAGLACDGENAVHVVRLGSAMKRRIITGRQFIEALQFVVLFTGSTIIRPDGDW